MADFPKLKTGAIAQYPSTVNFEHRTNVLTFVDGREQRWSECGRASRSWVLRFQNIDESEAGQLSLFFAAQGGRSGHFTFEDPFTGITHNDCSFDQDAMEIECGREASFSTTVTIRENR